MAPDPNQHAPLVHIERNDEPSEHSDSDKLFDEESVYLFFICCKPFGCSFWFAASIFALKTLLIWLLFANIVNFVDVSKNGYLGISGAVTLPVLISQTLALLLSVYQQNDITTGLRLRQKGAKKVRAQQEHILQRQEEASQQGMTIEPPTAAPESDVPHHPPRDDIQELAPRDKNMIELCPTSDTEPLSADPEYQEALGPVPGDIQELPQQTTPRLQQPQQQPRVQQQQEQALQHSTTVGNEPTINQPLATVRVVVGWLRERILPLFAPMPSWQWRMVTFLFLLDGAFGVTTTFILIVQSTTVLDVLLNFAAVAFITDLDETAYKLAQKSFFGAKHARAVVKVESGEIYSAIEEQERRTWRQLLSSMCTNCYFHVQYQVLTIFALVMIFWFVVAVGQVKGKYSPETLLVQFPDEIRSELAIHSGIYKLVRKSALRRLSQPIVYAENRNAPKRGQFAYCQKLRRWTFFLEGEGDKCDLTTIKAMSADTTALELTHAPREWFVNTPFTGFTSPLNDFFVSAGCTGDEECGGNARGRCGRDSQCICNPDFSGYRCSYDKKSTCGTIEIDKRFAHEFPTPRNVGESFNLIPNSESHGRPVYISTSSDYVMIFNGLRWGLMKLRNLLSPNEVIEDFDFDSINFAYEELVTSKVGFLSPDDRLNTPVGLNWFVVSPPQTSNVDGIDFLPTPQKVSLICSLCDDTINKCFNNGVCGTNHTCTCQEGVEGSLCQILPVNNGRCDSLFNNADFNYDGGDCCFTTCESTDENECGVQDDLDEFSYNDYPFCRDPRVLHPRCDGNVPCYVGHGTITTVTRSKPAVPMLSANGQVLVVSEPSFDLVSVYENVGQTWQPLGQKIEGKRANSIGVATPPGRVAGRPYDQGSLDILVALFDVFGNEVSVYSLVDSRWNFVGSTGKLQPDVRCHADLWRCNVKVEIGFSPGRSTTVLVEFKERNHTGTSVYWYSISEGAESRLLHNHTSTNRTLSSSLSEDGINLAVYGETEGEMSFRSFVHQGIEVETPVLLKGISAFAYSSRQGRSLSVLRYDGSRNRTMVQTYLRNRGQNLKLQSEREFSNHKLQAAKFSQDGNALVVVDGTDYHALAYQEAKRAWVPRGNVSVTRFSSTNLPLLRHVSISDGALDIAFVEETKTEVLHLMNQCEADEVMLRLVLALDRNPSRLSWEVSIAHEHAILNESLPYFVLATCHECYGNNVFARQNVVEEICVPRKEINCLQLDFHLDKEVEKVFSDNSYIHYTAVLLNETAVLRKTTGEVTSTLVSPFASECRKDDVVCDDGELPFTLIGRLDDFPDETTWTINSGSCGGAVTNEIATGGGYSIETHSVLEQVCLKEDFCHQLTIYDSKADGSCCQNGNGLFTGYLGQEKVVDITVRARASNFSCDFSSGSVSGSDSCLTNVTYLKFHPHEQYDPNTSDP